MISGDIKNHIYDELFFDAKLQVCAVIDGASAKGLLKQISSHKPKHCCLFTGDLHPEIAQTAPYLTMLEKDSPFTDWLINVWGNHFGIFAIAPGDIEFIRLRNHFRSFLRVRDPDGRPLFFRYYDPRVLQVYLPTCNAKELDVLFGPLRFYVTEEKDPEVMTRFYLDNDELVRVRTALVREETTQRM